MEGEESLMVGMLLCSILGIMLSQEDVLLRGEMKIEQQHMNASKLCTSIFLCRKTSDY